MTSRSEQAVRQRARRGGVVARGGEAAEIAAADRVRRATGQAIRRRAAVSAAPAASLGCQRDNHARAPDDPGPRPA